MKLVKVNRKGHPCNPVTVYEEDMLEGDVIVGNEKPIKDTPKQPPKKAAKKYR